MIRNLAFVLAAFFTFSLQASFAWAADPDPAGPETLCAQQQSTIRALENDREQMALEIYRLQDEIRQLNEILNDIRSKIGNGWFAPNSR